MGLFTSKEKKRMERQLAFRKAANSIERYVQRCEELRQEYVRAGREAAGLGDDKALRHYAQGILKLEREALEKRRMLLAFKGLKLEEQLAQLSTQFVGSLHDLSRTILEGVDPKTIATTQADLERALVHSEQVSETLSTAMESISEGILGTGVGDSTAIQDVVQGLKGQAGAEAAKDAVPAKVEVKNDPNDERIQRLMDDLKKQLREDA